jgi:hypothetical protein
MPFKKQLFLTRDIFTAWDAIDNGVVAQNNRTRENTGLTGAPTVPTSIKTPSYKNYHQTNKSSSLPPSLLGCGQGTTAKATLLKFKALQTRYQPLPKPSNWLDSTPQSAKHRALTKSQWHGLWKGTADRTHQQYHNSPCQLKSQTKFDKKGMPQTAPNKKQ